jgi:hypothetical protein
MNSADIASQKGDEKGRPCLKKIRYINDIDSRLPLGMPESLKSMYTNYLKPLRDSVLVQLGGGWEILVSSECYLLDQTYHDQHLHIDGESQSGLALNIVVMVEEGYQPQFNVVSGSHRLMSSILTTLESRSLNEDDYKELMSIASSMPLERLNYPTGYPILSLDQALHGGVSTGGKWVVKYHCMFVRSALIHSDAKLLPRHDDTRFRSIVENSINSNSESVVKNSKVY